MVLAAGMSSRMGSPKQLLRIEGKPVLELTLDNVRASSVDEMVLVLGFAADTIEKEVATQGVRIVRNDVFQEGMGRSLRAGLAALDQNARAALIVLADQPFVRAATLDRLMEFHQASGAQIVIPTYTGFRGNPVLLDRFVFPELNELSGDVGCRAIFGTHTENIRKLPVDDAGILLDIDSREDFQKLGKSAGVDSFGNVLIESTEAVPTGAPELILVGRDAVVQALTKFGRVLNFVVTIVDPFLPLSDMPEAHRVLHALDFSQLPVAEERYAVVASRGQFDEEAVAQALNADISYVALLANKRRAQELMESLRKQSVPPEKLAGVRAPAGLEIGAESPEEIALSIMAEIVKARKRPRNELIEK